MPLLRIEQRHSYGKKTDKKRVIVCACDNCQKQFEMRFKQSMFDSLLAGKRSCFCSKACANLAIRSGGATQERMRETCMKKWGADNASKSIEIRERMKQTCLTKYGKETYLGSDACIAATKLYAESLGVDSISAIPEVRQKANATMMANWGVINPLQSDVIKKKIIASMQLKHGVSWPTQTQAHRQRLSEVLKDPKVVKKRIESMRMNGTFQKQASKAEDLVFTVLTSVYPETKRHVTINGWNIDMYVPELDAYINYNGTYWHGKYKTEEELVESSSKIDKNILSTKKRDLLRREWFEKQDLSLFIIWEDDPFWKNIIKNPRMFSIVPGEDLKQTLDAWFGADPAMRKKKILGEA